MLRKQVRDHCEKVFVEKFGYYPAGFITCPASAILLGGHNGQDGLNLSIALDRHCTVAYGPRMGQIIRLVQTAPFRPEASHKIESFEMGRDLRTVNQDLKALHHMSDLMQRFGFGLQGVDLVVENDIGFVDPQNDPLGRFTALKLGFLKLQIAISKLKITSHSGAQMVLRSNMVGMHFTENNAHPIVSARAKSGAMMRVDRYMQHVHDIAFPEDLSALVIDTGKRKHNISQELMLREQQCKAAAKALRLDSLRSASSEQLQLKRNQFDSDVYQRAKCVVQENERVQRLLESGLPPSPQSLLRAMSDSQLALQDQYEVSCEEIDHLAYLIKAVCKQRGAVRLLGSGFGGYVMALVTHDDAKKILNSCIEPYRARFGLHPQFFISRPVAGVFDSPV